MKPFQLLIKPVSFDCNLRCDYCFYLRVSSEYPEYQHPRMNGTVLEKLISQFLKFRFNESIFTWQGGEPTLAGIKFFEKVVALQQKYGTSGQLIGNALQTNGILVNDEWAKLFNKYNFLIGLSLDGPKEFHDKYRKSIGKKSVWENVMKTIVHFKNNKVEFNILCVVSKANVNYAEKVYKFFVDNGFYHLQFIPALEEEESGKTASYSISSAQYGKFLCKLFDEWRKEPNIVSIRTFESILAYNLGYPKGNCVFEKECADYLLVEWNGDVYPCDFFVKKECKLGNILNEDFSTLKKRRNQKFEHLKSKLSKDCVKCNWLQHCFGGCVKERMFFVNKYPEKTYFCESYKIFFEYSNDWFKRQSTEMKKK